MKHLERLMYSFTVSLAVSSSVGPALSIHGDELFKLLPKDGAAHDAFGASIAMDDGIVAVGAAFDDDNGASSGSAYLFDASTGAQLLKLLANDGAALDSFGISIAIDDGIVAVGAHYDDDNGPESGSAYLFDASTGAQIAKLLPSDGAENDRFGTSIALDNGVVAVGAMLDGEGRGSAYLFDASTGAQIVKFLPTEGAGGYFGSSIDVDVSSGLVAVGAPHEQKGAVYLFEIATGNLKGKWVRAGSFRPQTRFGASVALDNGLLAIGEPLATANGARNAGAAFLYDSATGEQLFQLLPNGDGGGFGRSISIGGGVVAVAAGESPNGSSSGSAYLFDASTGVEVLRFFAQDGARSSVFGSSIAIGNGVAAVGAAGDDDNGQASGSAYLFRAEYPLSQSATLTEVTSSIEVEGGVEELQASDNDEYVLRSGPGFDPSEPHLAVADITFDTGGFAAGTLDITIEEKSNIGGPTAVVQLRDFTNSRWDEIGRHGLSRVDRTVMFEGIPGDNYIDGFNQMVVRVRSSAVLILDPAIRAIFSHDFVGVMMRE